MEEFTGGDPLNARIKIDYTGKKPSIKFSFPDRKKQKAGSMLMYIYFFWLLLNFPIILIIGPVGDDAPTKYDIMDIIVTDESSQYNLTDYNDFVNYLTDKDISEKLYNLRSIPLIDELIEPLKVMKISEMLYLLMLLFFPLLLFFPFRKRWNKLYPDFQALMASSKRVEFTARDVEKDGEGNYYCQIPLFSNILLDYTATGDFSHYLKFFEIREHNFKFIYKKNDVNEWMWYAKFCFDKCPRNGKLEVKFK